jgi:hypothetical protein
MSQILQKLTFIAKSSVADPDPVHFYPKDPGWFFLRIPDPYHVPNSIYLQDFTFKNGEKQEKLNFVWNMTSILTYSCMKKVFNFSLLLFVGSGSGIKDGRIRIQDTGTKKWSDPDPGQTSRVRNTGQKLIINLSLPWKRSSLIPIISINFLGLKKWI